MPSRDVSAAVDQDHQGDPDGQGSQLPSAQHREPDGEHEHEGAHQLREERSHRGAGLVQCSRDSHPPRPQLHVEEGSSKTTSNNGRRALVRILVFFYEQDGACWTFLTKSSRGSPWRIQQPWIANGLSPNFPLYF
ncbi:hypothetical protein QOT17_003768 [Balamuthia mandrillaris]